MLISNLDMMFGGYCYGPVDIVNVRKGDSTMWLYLRDSMEKYALAVYEGCVYWRIGRNQTGIHLPMVQKITADEFVERKESTSWRALKKNSDNVEKLIREWEDSGLNFYIHYGPVKDCEYLVVAKSLNYYEEDHCI